MLNAPGGHHLQASWTRGGCRKRAGVHRTTHGGHCATRQGAGSRRSPIGGPCTCIVGAAACARVPWGGCCARPGLPVVLLEGGYKAYKQSLPEFMGQDWPLVRIGGYTGSAKTAVVHALAARGEQVVDLEGLARHFGSAFGNLEQHAQPTSAHFRNLLAEALTALDAGRRIWVENESRRIGNVHLPEPFYKRMIACPCPGDCSGAPMTAWSTSWACTAAMMGLCCAKGFNAIRSELGGAQTDQALVALDNGDLATGARIALEYYDRTYEHRFAEAGRGQPASGRRAGHVPSKRAQSGWCGLLTAWVSDPPLSTWTTIQSKLTQYSHGAGCGCKIAPGVLDRILGELGTPGPTIRSCSWDMVARGRCSGLRSGRRYGRRTPTTRFFHAHRGRCTHFWPHRSGQCHQ